MMDDMCGWVGLKVRVECTKNFFWVASTVHLQSCVHWMIYMWFGKVNRVGHSMKMELIEKDKFGVKCWIYVGWGW
jgi:hypothetical protein